MRPNRPPRSAPDASAPEIRLRLNGKHRTMSREQLTAAFIEMAKNMATLAKEVARLRQTGIREVVDKVLAVEKAEYAKVHNDAARELHLLAEKTREAREAGVAVSREEMNEVLK